MRDETSIRLRLEQLRGQFLQWGTPDLQVFVITKDECRGWIRALEWVLQKAEQLSSDGSVEALWWRNDSGWNSSCRRGRSGGSRRNCSWISGASCSNGGDAYHAADRVAHRLRAFVRPGFAIAVPSRRPSVQLDEYILDGRHCVRCVPRELDRGHESTRSYEHNKARGGHVGTGSDAIDLCDLVPRRGCNDLANRRDAQGVSESSVRRRHESRTVRWSACPREVSGSTT